MFRNFVNPNFYHVQYPYHSVVVQLKQLKTELKPKLGRFFDTITQPRVRQRVTAPSSGLLRLRLLRLRAFALSAFAARLWFEHNDVMLFCSVNQSQNERWARDTDAPNERLPAHGRACGRTTERRRTYDGFSNTSRDSSGCDACGVARRDAQVQRQERSVTGVFAFRLQLTGKNAQGSTDQLQFINIPG